MKSRTWIWTVVICLFAALATASLARAAQDNQSNNKHQKYTAAKRPGPYTGTMWEDKQSPARAIDTSINDRNRDVRYTVTEIGVVPGEQYLISADLTIHQQRSAPSPATPSTSLETFT